MVSPAPSLSSSSCLVCFARAHKADSLTLPGPFSRFGISSSRMDDLRLRRAGLREDAARSGVLCWQRKYVPQFPFAFPVHSFRLTNGFPFAVAFLVIFFLLLAMFIWSYIKILVVGPGHAKDVVKSGLEGRPYETFPPSPVLPPPSHDHQQHSAIEMRESQESHSSTLALRSPPDHSSPLPSETHSDPRPHTTLLAQAPGNLAVKSKRSICAPPPFSTQRWEAKGRAEALAKQYGGDGVLERLPGRPEEDGRWCEYCNLSKPLRTHQCVTFSLRSALEALKADHPQRFGFPVQFKCCWHLRPEV